MYGDVLDDQTYTSEKLDLIPYSSHSDHAMPYDTRKITHQAAVTWWLSLQTQTVYTTSVIFINENENGEKQETNEFVNEN